MNATPSAPPLVRWSHALLGLAVVHQILASEWMTPPWEHDDASPVSTALFELHEWVGLASGVVLMALVAGLVGRYGGSGGFVSRFLPWLRPDGRAQASGQALSLVRELFRRLRVPQQQETGVLAAACEGLGLAAIAFMASTGAAMWAFEDSTGAVRSLAEIHEGGALLVQVYLAGHVIMALLHELNGEGLLRAMRPGRS